MRQQIRNALALSACVLGLAIAGCGQETTASRHVEHRPQYGRIYQAADGNYYTRSYDDGQFWFWMYVLNSGSSTSASASSPAYFSSGSWSRVSAAPTGLTPTSLVVEEDENGQPTEEATEASAVNDAAVVDEETTAAEAEAETADASSGEAASESGGMESSGGESMGDSGGGDSGGGGDGGGGGGDGGE